MLGGLQVISGKSGEASGMHFWMVLAFFSDSVWSIVRSDYRSTILILLFKNVLTEFKHISNGFTNLPLYAVQKCLGDI